VEKICGGSLFLRKNCKAKESKMPKKEPSTSEYRVLWEYAKAVPGTICGGIEDPVGTLRELVEKKKKWQGILKKDTKTNTTKCAYCGDTEDLTESRIVFKKGCRHVEMHNTITVCGDCISFKGEKDLLEWWGHKRIDKIPRPVLAKYLKMLYRCHECEGTFKDPRENTSLSRLTHIFKSPCNLKSTGAHRR